MILGMFLCFKGAWQHLSGVALCYDLSTGESGSWKNILQDAYLKLDTDSDDIPWKLW